MPSIKITTPEECNFFVLDEKGYSKRSVIKKWDVVRIEDKDNRAFSPSQMPGVSVFIISDVEKDVDVETGEQKLVSVTIRPFHKLEMLRAAEAWGEEETDKLSVKGLFVKRWGMKEEEYDEMAEKLSKSWKRFIAALERREMSYSGAASTITNEHKNLRYLKGINDQLDSIKTIMKVAFETYDENMQRELQLRLQKKGV